ncbi:MAG: zincin-like metallopeptidase domain-containing protein [Erysipelotrichaceae bacterium]|nr:zincin-like metallopeptidase domain-containing protein [Erysipelotrichaceae bacterium]
MAATDKRQQFRENLADQFLHLLETKQMNWIQEWQSSAMKIPFNGITERKYKGVNRFSLILTAMVKGYEDPRWVTMAQIIDKNDTYHRGEQWHLKAGSKAAQVEYWFPYDKVKKKNITWDEYRKEIRSREQSDFLIRPKYFHVFNASLVEGMEPFRDEQIEHRDIHPDELIGKLSKNMNVPILYDGGGNAYYSPSQDQIHLPDPTVFTTAAAFNGTALHELAHSTGHKERLNRDLNGFFGSESYAFEELIAEMTSCFMAVSLKETDLSSFNRFENNEAYLQNWISHIREKPEALVKTIKHAQAAANYMDYKAELITEKEYLQAKGETMEIKEEERIQSLESRITTAELSVEDSRSCLEKQIPEMTR